MQSLDENQLGCPGPSLWNLITEHVRGSEVPKVRTALGHSLVDMYIELHREAEMCYKMWQESQQGGNHGSRAGSSTPCQQVSPLPDPPAVKELLRAEVKMLLQTLRERASRGGRDGDELLLRYNPDTVNYALGHRDSWLPTCASSGETDDGSKAGHTIRPSSHCSTHSSIEDEIKAVSDKLNATGIGQVVERLKSVVLEECDALKTRLQDLKTNINQKHRRKREFPKPEPRLVELRELREAVQMDLDLYPTSRPAPSTDLFHPPVKGLKYKLRLSAGHVASDETLQVLTAASVLRPHPPRPLCPVNPRPPAGPPHTNTARSVRPIHTSSLPVTHGQHRRISSGHKSKDTPVCIEITTSEEANGHFTTDQINKCEQHCRLSPEQHGAGLHRRDSTSSPRFQMETQRMLPVQDAHLSYHSLDKEFDLSPCTERTNSAQRSRNTSINPSQVPALSHSSNSTDNSVSTTGELKTHNGQRKSTCGGSFVSTAEQPDKDRVKVTPEGFYSLVFSGTESASSQNDSGMSNSGIESGFLRKNSNHQQSLTDSLRHSEKNSKRRQSKCAPPVAVQINTQVASSHKRPLDGSTAQPESVQETRMEMINMFYQPVPPT